MSAARLLRLAAQKMRQEADLPYVRNEWEATDAHVRVRSTSARIGYPAHAEATCSLYSREDEVVANEAIAAYIAAWSPPVALAVADWLEATARELDSLGDPDLSAHPQDGRRTAALRVARTYLGAEVSA